MISGTQFLNTGLDARFGQMNACQGLMNMMANPNAMPPEQAHEAEKNLQLQKVNNGTLAQASEVAYESAEKQKDQDIKRSFNYMA